MRIFGLFLPALFQGFGGFTGFVKALLGRVDTMRMQEWWAVFVEKVVQLFAGFGF